MKLRRKLRVLAIAIGAVAALAAIVASPAMAEKVATKFSASTIKLSGTGLTVKKNGGEPKTCELKSASGTTGGAGTSSVYNEISPGLQTALQCAGGTKLWLTMLASSSSYDTVTGAYAFQLHPGNTSGFSSPFGLYRPGYGGKEMNAGWTNGSGSTPSTIDFNETYLGELEPGLGGTLTLSGTMTATTSTGGLLTLSH